MSNIAVIEQPQARQTIQVIDPIPVLDTGRFEQMQRIATVMAKSSLVPDALCKGKDEDGKDVWLPLEQVVANCFLVVNQAVRWGMDPFGVAQCVSVVRGRICYEGKLVAAVLDAKLGIDLNYEYNGRAGGQLGVVVSGAVNGKTKTVDGTVDGWKTTRTGSPWANPEAHKRQLAYRGAREWARIHKPSIMLGVYTDDELSDLAKESRTSQLRMAPPPPPPLPKDAATQIAPAAAKPSLPPAPPPPPPARVEAGADDPDIFDVLRATLKATNSADEANAAYETWMNAEPRSSEDLDEGDAILREEAARFWADGGEP